MGQGGLAAQKGAVEGRGEYFAPALQRQFRKRHFTPGRDIVHQVIQTPERRDGGFHHPGNIVGPSDVAEINHRFPAALLDLGDGLFGVRA